MLRSLSRSPLRTSPPPCRRSIASSAAGTFYSVAQHAVLVHDLVVEAGHPELAATALHHDSAEAYVCDLPSPLKALLQAKGNHAYRDAADRLDEAIASALGHEPSPSGAEIKLADLRALLIEAAELLPDRGEGSGLTSAPAGSPRLSA